MSKDDKWALRMAEREGSEGFPGVTGSLVHRSRNNIDLTQYRSMVTLSKDVRKVVDSLDTLDTSADLHLKFKKGTPLKFKRKVRRYFKKYIMPDMQKVVREKFMNVLVFGSRERPEL